MYSKIDRLMLFFAQPSDAIAAGCSPINKKYVYTKFTERSGWGKKENEIKKHNVLSMVCVSSVAAVCNTICMFVLSRRKDRSK